MKTKLIHLFLTGFLFLSVSIISNSQVIGDLLGEWSFDAPQAPEGATFGQAIIKADTVIMRFEGGLQFPSDWVKSDKDSIVYETTFDEVKVKFALKIIDEQTLAGKAIHSDGDVPITFRRKKT
ncbi:MAG TPA: hypothetical protein VHO46_15290 [Bacteroidales bacterium]|nr:hypothetical protein [Bacteroidales bacterium]